MKIRMAYCRECRKMKKVVGFEKDDPLLSCGHVKHRRKSDDWIHVATADIHKFFAEEAEKSGLSFEQVQEECAQALIKVFCIEKEKHKHFVSKIIHGPM